MKVDISREPVHVEAADLENGKILTYACYPCPNCGRWIYANVNNHYCSFCGVKLEWGEESEKNEN